MMFGNRIYSIIGLSAIGYVKADFNMIKTYVKDLANAPANATQAIADQMVPRQRLVGVGVDFNKLATRLDRIVDYGCWCYFQDNHGKGKGNPVNRMDQICRYMHDGYSCAMMDGVNEGYDDCVPWKVRYNSFNILGALGSPFQGLPGFREEPDMPTDPEGYMIVDCERNNPGPDFCGYRACIVEGYFLLNLITAFLDSYVIDDQYSHSEGFKPEENCPIDHHGGRNYDLMCCGLYPERAPFRGKVGQRECCGKKTYNPVMNRCCDDGTGLLSVQVSCI